MSLWCGSSKPSSGVIVPSVIVGSGVSSSGRLVSSLVNGPVTTCDSDSGPPWVSPLATSEGIAVVEKSFVVIE